MRRIVRKLISMGFEDNIRRTKSPELSGAAHTMWLTYAKAEDPLDSDNEDFVPDDETWDELFFPYADSTCLSFEEVHEMERDFKRQKSEISAQTLKLQSLEAAFENLESSQKNSDSRAILELKMQHEIAMADKQLDLAKLQLRIAELSKPASGASVFEQGDSSVHFFTAESEQAQEPKNAEDFATLVKLRKTISSHPSRYSLDRLQKMFNVEVRREIEGKLAHMRVQARLPEFLHNYDEKVNGVPRWLIPDEGLPNESIIERYLLVNYRDNEGALLSQKQSKDLDEDTVVHFLQERMTKKWLNLQVSLENGPKAQIQIATVLDRLKCEALEGEWNQEQKKYLRVPRVIPEAVNRVERDNSKLFLKRVEELYADDSGKDGLSRWVTKIIVDERALISLEG